MNEGTWGVCSCGHIAQDHNNKGECQTIACCPRCYPNKCPGYNGKYLEPGQTLGANTAGLLEQLRAKDEEIQNIKAVEFPQKVEAVAKANKIAGLLAARDAPVADAIFTNRAKLEGFHLGVNAKVRVIEELMEQLALLES